MSHVAACDTPDTGTPITNSYCYDNTDRLIASTVVGAPTGTNPVAEGLAAAELAYDAHRNTTTLADQMIGYDVSDRHVQTTMVDGTRIEYLRDVTGRIKATVAEHRLPGRTWNRLAAADDIKRGTRDWARFERRWPCPLQR